MDDSSLDDFLDAGGECSSDDEHDPASSDEGVNAAQERDADSAGEATVPPARSTMTFSPDAGECGICGDRVTRRWTDDGHLVCRDCKEW